MVVVVVVIQQIQMKLAAVLGLTLFSKELKKSITLKMNSNMLVIPKRRNYVAEYYPLFSKEYSAGIY